jgi:hypothetical protein
MMVSGGWVSFLLPSPFFEKEGIVSKLIEKVVRTAQ